MVDFFDKANRCLKLPGVDSPPIVVLTGSRLIGIYSWDNGLQRLGGGISICFADSGKK